MQAVDELTNEELAGERVELLPDREAMTLLTDPTAMKMPSLLASPDTAGSGAGDYASGTAGDASGLGGHLADASAGEPYSPTDTASAS